MAGQTIKFTAEEVARRVSHALLPSRDLDLGPTLSKPLSIVIAFLILSLAIPACPPVKTWIIAQYPQIWPISSMSANWSGWSEWLDFVSFLLELLLAVFVGGSIYSQWLASKAQEIINSAGSTLETKYADRLEAIEKELIETAKRYEQNLSKLTAKNFLTLSWTLYRDAHAIFVILVKTAPWANARFLAAKFAIAFPGGLFGLVAFILFWLLEASKVFSLYHAALTPVA